MRHPGRGKPPILSPGSGGPWAVWPYDSRDEIPAWASPSGTSLREGSDAMLVDAMDGVKRARRAQTRKPVKAAETVTPLSKDRRAYDAAKSLRSCGGVIQKKRRPKQCLRKTLGAEISKSWRQKVRGLCGGGHLGGPGGGPPGSFPATGNDGPPVGMGQSHWFPCPFISRIHVAAASVSIRGSGSLPGSSDSRLGGRIGGQRSTPGRHSRQGLFTPARRSLKLPRALRAGALCGD